MDCKTFSERLEDFLDGRLGAAERETVRAHLAACTGCRAQVETPGIGTDRNPPEPPPDFAEAVLERTSGPTCAGARDRLAGYSDGSLPPVDSELVRLHLEGCDDCAALSRALVRMSADLPVLAELDPGVRFVDEVIAVTSAGRRRRWTARMAAGWESLVRRPRFALEGAYVATFVFVLMFGIPTGSFAGMSRQVRGLLEVGPGSGIEQPMADLQDRMSSSVEELETRWEELESKANAASREIREDVARRTTGPKEKIAAWIGTIRDRLASDQVNEPVDPAAGEPTGEQGEEKDERK